MRCKYFNNGHTCEHDRGFTLIELLVVVSIISILMAILMPVLGKVRVVQMRLKCATNLRQIAYAWHLYLADHKAFYKGINTNHDFGGWHGTGGLALERPLNEYVGLPLDIDTEKPARLFRCPADQGGIFGMPEQELAWQFFGNSYQTNIILIGPTRIGMAPPGPVATLFAAIDKRMRAIKLTDVSAASSKVLLVGDNNWMSEWYPLIASHSKAWHGKDRYHNMAFLDVHVEFLKIRKGLFVTPAYNILPFRQLYSLAYEVQEEIE
jgi:prepilin-type N-terminal cleavage/methylation domain-containing protein